MTRLPSRTTGPPDRPAGPAAARRGRQPGGGKGLPGVAVAGVTALISGVAVFVNSHGVHALPSPSVYTTAKNLVATVVLGGSAVVGLRLRRRRPRSVASRFVAVQGDAAGPGLARPGRPTSPVLRWIGLAYVGIVGGGLAFVLFFDGLADTTATPAAFWRDTLLVWVAVLAVPFLHERVAWWNTAAIALLVVGEVAVAGGTGHLAATRGEVLVLGSSALWAIEVVVAKRLLRDLAPATLSLVRMGIGTVTLVAYLAASGSWHGLVSLSADQIGWAVLTGMILAGYVATWMTALARARAIDVTSILVAGALVTAFLQAAAGTGTLVRQALGLALIAVGAGIVAWMGLRRPVRVRPEAVSR